MIPARRKEYYAYLQFILRDVADPTVEPPFVGTKVIPRIRKKILATSGASLGCPPQRPTGLGQREVRGELAGGGGAGAAGGSDACLGLGAR